MEIILASNVKWNSKLPLFIDSLDLEAIAI